MERREMDFGEREDKKNTIILVFKIFVGLVTNITHFDSLVIETAYTDILRLVLRATLSLGK